MSLLTGGLYKDARRALIDAAAEVIARRGVEAASTPCSLARTAPKALVVF
jgi:DNA-binding transcriptional regulator YbjK